MTKRVWRYNNPKNRSKTEGEHITHFMQRLKERFDLEITLDEYYSLIKEIQTKSIHLYSINQSNGIYVLSIKGVEVWIIYGSNSKFIPARLKTALIPYTQYVAPDSLFHVYDHHEFTDKVNEVIYRMIDLSTQLDLNNKKEFFIKNIDSVLKKGAYIYKRSNDEKRMMVKCAVGYIIKTKGLK